MNIVLIGYGKMGKTIHRLAEERNHSITGVIDVNNSFELEDIAKKSDVAIEFTNPDSAYNNIKSSIELGLPIVSGTTGWLDRYHDICALSTKKKIGFFYASNYSIGVNIFYAVNKKLAELMSPYQEYDVHIKETHHIHKLDKPSGTAITTAEGILEYHHSKSEWIVDDEDVDKLKIQSIREGEVYGRHEVHYNSKIDEITLTHNALSRDGFALGALTAAEWIVDQKGPHGMKDLLGL